MLHLIIWKGYGILVPVIVVGSFFSMVIFKLDTTWFKNPDDAFTFITGTWALLFWVLGNHLNREEGGFNPRRIDLKLRSRHSFFFIPMQWWGLLFFLLTLLLIFGA